MRITYQLEEIDETAATLLENVPSKVWLFYGDMGVGKTTLIAHIFNKLGIPKEQISSPTFSLVNEYESDQGEMFHFDLYRLKYKSELIDIGFEDYFHRNARLICIEWPEFSELLVPENAAKIYIEAAGENRVLNIQ